ncbi:uncharacterized protein JN550_009803 [Neoarthrinium moseri]|uniref:uncharacterized protein n=1 Tax=Neoarthrinium moseri TaxID=1658444 RepID=UPI001FDDE4A8|nr:uncharacterized protein JN550_009803 [Neoarthrinium moseri]KAI1863277.1 hypothetical protein JN550_009803 [Neoarthrinium moseri]
MKTTLLALFAFGGLFASTIANPIGAVEALAKRQDDEDFATQGVALEDLFAKVQEQTGQINKTVDAVPDTATGPQTDKAAADIAPQLDAITVLLSTAADNIAKRDLQARHGWKKADIFVIVSKLIYEILCTVKVLLFKLGLAKVIIYLTPLVLALVKLLKALDHVVAGLLLAVKSIANELLKAVGLGLLGLI